MAFGHRVLVNGANLRCPRPPGFARFRRSATMVDLNKLMEEAMGPRKNPRQPIFRDHNCWKCREGELPCPQGYSHLCEYPHARND